MELTIEQLKEIASSEGVRFQWNTSIKKLKDDIIKHCLTNNKNFEALVDNYLHESTPSVPVDTTKINVDVNKFSNLIETPEESKVNRMKEARLKKRVKVIPLDPAVADKESDYFAVANDKMDKISVLVPYNTIWHVPVPILKMLEEKVYPVFVHKKGTNPDELQKDIEFKKSYEIQYLEPIPLSEYQGITAKLRAEGFGV